MSRSHDPSNTTGRRCGGGLFVQLTNCSASSPRWIDILRVVQIVRKGLLVQICSRMRCFIEWRGTTHEKREPAPGPSKVYLSLPPTGMAGSLNQRSSNAPMELGTDTPQIDAPSDL